jgi:alanine racemase
MGPTSDIRAARDARLELAVGQTVPEDIAVHVKLDTGMGRWGVSELRAPARNVVGLMTHLATADTDPDFAREQIRRFGEATAEYTHLTRHVANSAASLRLPEARFDAGRCGIALYGLSPFGGDPADDGLTPVLAWRSELALVRRLSPGESTGYGRTFVADRETWIGLVPVGYADGFRRDLTGTEVLVAGEPRRVIGTVSMDSFAVELDGRVPLGAEVVIVGPGVPLESHARVAGTINYELAGSIPARHDDLASPVVERVERSLRDEVRACDEQAKREGEATPLREARRLDEAREHADCACFDAAYGPPFAATAPAIDTMFTTADPSPSPRKNARTHHTPPR